MKFAVPKFFKNEASGALVLGCAAAAALIWSNSPFADGYKAVFNYDIVHWINDGLMVLFFLLVGLEIKRELTDGELSTKESALLPLLAAMGGMVVPALIYLAINFQHPQNWNGWAIPSATDIAFAVGLMAAFGSRVPLPLKIFLLAIAVMDDLGAIIIIALFYGGDIDISMLAIAAVVAGIMFSMNMRIKTVWPYLLMGVVLWYFSLESGIHATIAGVITAMAIPTPRVKDVERKLHKPVSFLILPIFGLANAGISFAGMGFESLLEPVAFGIALALPFGKAIGIFGVCCIFFCFFARPEGVCNKQLLAMSLMCGIGFTMSLFIGLLAFPDELMRTEMRLGVFAGSIISAVAGTIIMAVALKDTHKNAGIAQPAPTQEISVMIDDEN
ncbi:MAG: Na+/H+ antiporter NhaA [Alphaproteobacteria bacterium]|nr:Na+/H+ antiporter NhaA [Alphaproteobacteria bacterium]